MILHITNDYAGSAVYKNLVRELDNLGIEQIIYTPVKNASSIGKNEIQLNTKVSKIIYSNILNKSSDRAFYKLKIKKILKDIESKVDLEQINFIHAHTWYSDGGVAYLIHKKFNIPYIATIRSTDLAVFQKYLIHERAFGRQIIQQAKNIILIQASSQSSILQLSSLEPIRKELSKKLKIIPNGVDPYWIKHAKKDRLNRTPTDNFNILYIGKFSKNKNVKNLQEAVLLLNSEINQKIKLHLVGGGGSEEKNILDLINEHPDQFKYHGKIYDKNALQDIFQSCSIFAMPSKHETFGLVYVEALLQGLPILYTEGEGIDGIYSEKIGEKVSVTISVKEIKNKLQTMLEHYSEYNIPTDKLIKNHDWKIIAKKYREIYTV